MPDRRTSVWEQLGRGITRVRSFVANTLFVMLLLIVLLALFARTGPSVPDGAALVLNPRGVIVDQETVIDPLTRLLAPEVDAGETPLRTVTRALEKAADDERITLAVLDLDELQAVSTAHAESIGEAIRTFQAADKQVIAYGRYFSQQQYLIASHADALYMHPMGQLLLPGYGINKLYFNKLLDRLDINVHIFRVGKYKEFVEPYERDEMSDEAREANQTMVDALWARYRERIVGNRGIDARAFTDYTETFPSALEKFGDTATVALEYRLIDELLTPDAAEARIGDQVGFRGDGSLNGIGFEDYLLAVDGDETRSDAPSIGVITAQGPIVVGHGARGVIATESIIELIRAARRDDDIAAIVLRIDSPGGSAFASELIRQELELAQLGGKPVVVSMSSVAASGGYWISSTADRIVAQPSTLTGSIGVFGLFPTFEDTLSEIGVSTDGVGTTPLSRALDPFAGLGEDMARVLQLNVEQTYRQFLNLVARGREMTPAEVDALAQGRVWIGDQALELGLVDALGDLDQAIEEAAALARLDRYGIEFLSTRLSARELLFSQLGENLLLPSLGLPEMPLLRRLGDALDLVSALDVVRALDDPRSSYALCEACVSASP